MAWGWRIPIGVVALLVPGALGMGVGADGQGSAVGQPDVRILYTHDANGFLQTCGCAGTAVTGLAQAVGVARKLRADLPSCTLAVDAGNLAPDEARGRLVWGALRESGCDLVALGMGEQAWETPYWSMVAESPMPVLSLRRPAAGTSASPTMTRRVGGRTVGFVVTPPAQYLSEDDALRLAAPLRPLRVRCDLVVLLTSARLADLRPALQGEWSGLVDLVIGAAGSERLQVPETVGRARVLPAALLGRAVGVADVSFQGDAPPALQWHLERITGESPADKGTAARVASFYGGQQESFLSANSTEDLDALADYGYIRPERCGECHAVAYDGWKASRHGDAVKTLVDRESAAPECLPCHSQAYRQARKVLAGDRPQGVECGSCHAGGVLHSVAPAKGNIGRGSKAACATCHTPERSPKFDAEAYLARIRHWRQ